MNCVSEIRMQTIDSDKVGKLRLLFGILMLISGLYFGLFSVGIGEGLGFLSVLASPFVMVADK